MKSILKKIDFVKLKKCLLLFQTCKKKTLARANYLHLKMIQFLGIHIFILKMDKNFPATNSNLNY